MKNFESGNHFFFSKKIQPTNAAEKALCTKRHFSNRNHSIKKNPQKFPKFQNFAKLFSEKKQKKPRKELKIKIKNIYIKKYIYIYIYKIRIKNREKMKKIEKKRDIVLLF